MSKFYRVAARYGQVAIVHSHRGYQFVVDSRVDDDPEIQARDWRGAIAHAMTLGWRLGPGDPTVISYWEIWELIPIKEAA